MMKALVIGAGPAGLMAAEELADYGFEVTVADAKPSPARKFLMAGKSGLNLTKDETIEQFLGNIHGSSQLRDIVRDFGPAEVQDWVRALGQEVFTGTSGRVFPKAMKASPLLRAWLKRLDEKRVVLRSNMRWIAQEGRKSLFETPNGAQEIVADVTVLALGGASWSKLGSDGQWVSILLERGVNCCKFKPSNMGFVVGWSSHMERHFGSPIKPVGLRAGETVIIGEFVLSAKGIEGSAVYAVSRELRRGAELFLDLAPARGLPEVVSRLARNRGKSTLANHLRKSLALSPAKLALLQEFARPLPNNPYALGALVKALVVPIKGPRPLDEAISSAGGVAFDAVTSNLMLKDMPGVFTCGEMLDWEAPTGGYLLTTCLATGRHAGRGAAEWAQANA